MSNNNNEQNTNQKEKEPVADSDFMKKMIGIIEETRPKEEQTKNNN